MQAQMIMTLCILGIAAILFISGRIRADLVAVCVLIVMVMLGILDAGEALSGFSSSIVIMMIGLFVVGGGIFHTGLAAIVSDRLLKLAGHNETRLLITIMVATSFIGAFVSNTGTVAVMLPIVVSLAKSANISPSRLLMPLAFASSIGGSLTLIGTPPNIVIRETLMNAGYKELSFFSFTPIGFTSLLIGCGLIIVFSKLFLPKGNEKLEKSKRKRTMAELAEQYQVSQNLFRVQVKESSELTTCPLHELDISNRFQLHIVEIRRKPNQKHSFFKTIHHEKPGADTIIQKDDILYLYGEFVDVKSFCEAYRLKMLDRQVTEGSDQNEASHSASFASPQIGIAEVLLTPNSRLTNQTVEHSGIRENYNINVLSIQRQGKYLFQQLKNERLRFGDALLVQGDWASIARLSQEQSDVVVVGQPEQAAANVPLKHKAPLAAAIMILMVVLLILEIFPAVVSVMLAAVLMVATGCVRGMEAAYNSINWESIVLIGGMIPASIAIEKTGAAALLSEQLVAGLGSFGPLILLAGIYFATSMLTLFISNTACAVLLAPIALSAAEQIGVSPVPYMFAVALAAGMCFAVPFSTPPNALVMSAGRYKFIDYIKVGLPLQLLLGIALIMLIPLFFPF